MASLSKRWFVTYDLDFCLAAVFNTQWEGSLQSALVLQQQKGLVRPLPLAAVLCRQADRECVLGVEGDGRLERGFRAESVRRSQQLARSEAVAGRRLVLDSLLLGSLTSRLLAADGDTAIVKAPRRCSLDSTGCQEDNGGYSGETHIDWLEIVVGSGQMMSSWQDRRWKFPK